MFVRAGIILALTAVALARPACAQESGPFEELPTAPSSTKFETSWRVSSWSGTRVADPASNPVLQAEVWARVRTTLNESVDAKFNAWAALDPIGTGQSEIDVREAALEARVGAAAITIGRQLFVWGRADKINPTDVLSARDFRRLTDDDLDQRLGLFAVSASAPFSGGTMSLHWVPEFRPTRLPQSFDAPGLVVKDMGAQSPERQFALRFERFGNRADWSVTLAQVADRTPWLDVTKSPSGRPELHLNHPDMTMIGGDFASTLGKIGVRGEAAFYDYQASDLGQSASRRPQFQGVIGLDRDFGNQLNIIVQAGARLSDQISPIAGPLAASNAHIQVAWRDVVGAAFVRVRKGIKDDRGSVEAALGAYQEGGTYASVRVNSIIKDGVRLILQGEHFSGPANSYFGRLTNNSLISMTLRFGF